MGETKPFHFYDFGFFDPVAKPHKQLFVALETPGQPQEIKKKHRLCKDILVL